MYICTECNAHFDQPGGYREAHGEWIVTCPRCNTTDFEDANECKCCGKLDLVTNLTDGLCDTCIGMWRSALYAVMHSRFTAQERHYISIAMDGEAIEYDDPGAA